MVRDDDEEREEEDDEAATFPNDPRGSSLHAPVSKMVAASEVEGGEDEEDFKAAAAAVAFETLAATSARPFAPRKPTRATSSTVFRASSAQANDEEGRADRASLRASEMPLARQAVVDDDDGAL